MLIPRKALVVWGIMASIPFGLAVPMDNVLSLIPKTSSFNGPPHPTTSIIRKGNGDTRNSEFFIECTRPTQTFDTLNGKVHIDQSFKAGHKNTYKEDINQHGTTTSESKSSFCQTTQTTFYQNKNLAAAYAMLMPNAERHPNLALGDGRGTSSSSKQNLRIEPLHDNDQESAPVNQNQPIITELDADGEHHQSTPAIVELPDEGKDEPQKIQTVTQPKTVEKPKQKEPEKKEPEQEKPRPSKEISYPHFMIIVKTRFGMTEKIKKFENYIKLQYTQLHEKIQAGSNVELQHLVQAHMSWAIQESESDERFKLPSLYELKPGAESDELLREPLKQMSDFYLDELVQILHPKMTATELKSFEDFVAANGYTRAFHNITQKPWNKTQVEEVYEKWKNSPKDFTFHASHIWDKLKHYAISSWEYFRKLFKKDD